MGNSPGKLSQNEKNSKTTGQALIHVLGSFLVLWTGRITNDALQRTEKTRNNTQSTKMKVKQEWFPQYQETLKLLSSPVRKRI